MFPGLVVQVETNYSWHTFESVHDNESNRKVSPVSALNHNKSKLEFPAALYCDFRRYSNSKVWNNELNLLVG